MLNTKDKTWFTGYRLLAIIGVVIGVHVLLSYAGFVPSEVSEFNQRVIEKARSLHRLSYSAPEQPVLPRSSLSKSEAEEVIGEEPKHITINKINVDVSISTPDKTTISSLDAALNEGVVHYPGSGGIGGNRRMFLFGHSSRLPSVSNQAYRSFNGLHKLVNGDEITISGSGKRQTYRVTSVEVVDEDEALVSFGGSGGKLTLSTCTTFGSRENRVVVQADLVDSTTTSG